MIYTSFKVTISGTTDSEMPFKHIILCNTNDEYEYDDDDENDDDYYYF